MEDAYNYAVTRQTFGKPLIERPTIRAKFTEVGLQVMGAHSLLECIMQLKKDTDLHATNGTVGPLTTTASGLCALVKVSAARAADFSARECQQVFGAAGYTSSGPGARVERISRDVRALLIGGGSEEILCEMSLSQERKDLESLKMEANRFVTPRDTQMSS